MSKKTTRIIRLERDGGDHVIPRGFFDILVHRFFPVLSLTYVSMVLSIATEKKDFIHFVFEDKTAYVMALFVVLWVSGPGLMWIFLNGSIMLSHVADLWYKIIAALMTLTIMISFLLFPEAEIWGLRVYFIMTIPIFVIIYFFFVRGGLPAVASYPLNFIGLAALVYGAMINVIF